MLNVFSRSSRGPCVKQKHFPAVCVNTAQCTNCVLVPVVLRIECITLIKSDKLNNVNNFDCL